MIFKMAVPVIRFPCHLTASAGILIISAGILSAFLILSPYCSQRVIAADFLMASQFPSELLFFFQIKVHTFLSFRCPEIRAVARIAIPDFIDMGTFIPLHVLLFARPSPSGCCR